MIISRSMKVIHPTAITDALLVSSTAPENDYAAWNGATAYTAGQRVIRTATHRIYERLVNGTTATAPENDTTNWLDIGPTNRWAMLDDVVGTQTSLVTPLTVVLTPGAVGGIALLELQGRTAQVSMKDAPGGTTVYSVSVDLDDTVVESLYDWFFNPYVQRTDLILADLPAHFEACELTVSVTSTVSSTVQCGVCKVGRVVEIGATRHGAMAGITDYSKKEVDAWGRYSIVKRGFSKRANLPVVIDKADLSRVFRELSGLRATPCIWIATEAEGYSPLLIYGFFKDFSIDVAYPTHHLCSFDLEGLI